ncbi:aspartate aminotransferase family protein [Silvibacterium acidisoli]|uniref:aspartate aminotransferase family protein n=1 Tax=Acidobacteriaceae bacterium ZG23-2 TaxID=2883246 RepID=UPI00406C6AB3
MHPLLEKELATFESRTPSSHAALKRAEPRMPLGVASNFRSYEPWPLFVKDAKGSHFHDLDGNEYVDFNLCFGALMAGHCHPAVMAAVEERLKVGTMYGMPHTLEYELAEEICQRFPVEQVRFGSSGTEVTMHAIRLARGYTGRDKIIKMEGAYHGVHDSVLVSMKPAADLFGDPERPAQVPASGGVPADTVKNTLVAQFNDLAMVERLFAENRGQIAGVIIEPIMMNIGICMPEPGYLEGLREICTREGAMLIFDEVKTGAKLGRGGACEYFGVKADIVALAKSIGGGFPLAAFATSKKVMDAIAQHKVFHAGTYATNPLVMAAGLATFREVLTPEGYAHIARVSEKLVAGYKEIAQKNGIAGYVESAGANGAMLYYPGKIRNYRDWLKVDVDLWRLYWFGMVNRGVMAQPYWWDEQWTLSVAHSMEDVDRHLTAFEDLAPSIAQMQQRAAPAKA